LRCVTRTEQCRRSTALIGRDVVLQVARALPLQSIPGLLGVALEGRDKLFDWTNKVIGDGDPELPRTTHSQRFS